MDAIVLARENALLKARLAQVEAALAEVQEANRRLEDMPHARRSARNSASAPRSCRPTSSTCLWKMPNWPRVCSRPHEAEG
jgi:hypothetical protein